MYKKKLAEECVYKHLQGAVGIRALFIIQKKIMFLISLGIIFNG